MIYIWLNLLPILIAAIAGLAVGTAWRALIGAPTQPGRGPIAATFAAQAWLAAILAGALILAPPKADPWVIALGTAIIIWIGFVAPATIVTLAARAARAATIASECAYWLAVMLTQTVVLHLIGLTPPPHP